MNLANKVLKKEARPLTTVVHTYGCYLAQQLVVQEHSKENCDCDCHIDEILNRFRGPENKLYWTEFTVFAIIGFFTLGSFMLVSLYGASQLVNTTHTLTMPQTTLGIIIFAVFPFVLAFILSILSTDFIMKHISTKSQGSKEE